MRLSIALLITVLSCPALSQPLPLLHDSDLVPQGRSGWIAPQFALPPPDPALPIVDQAAVGPEYSLLRQLAARGQAAGFAGVIYDNRDRGHSPLARNLFPGLRHLDYGPELQSQGLDLGLAGMIRLPQIVLGNSSTAITRGAAPRSLPRLAMTQPEGPLRAYLGYRSNHLYVYPEHRDHDAEDLFPANWPYMVISQGSSGSDQPFVRSLAATIAAFSPETRRKLRDAGLIAPTLQMILRRSLSTVQSEAAYLSAAAHPTVFEADWLRPERMVALAASMQPDAFPPVVEMRVTNESFAGSAGLGQMSERLFTTPAAIARVWRDPAFRQFMEVSVAGTRDPNGREVTFHWAILRGDPGTVRIMPGDKDGRNVRIEFDWREPRPVSPRQGRLSSRYDIAVFASNGVHPGAPSIISVSFPDHESRHYAPDGDGVPRLMSVDYDALGRGIAYDPVLHWSAPWSDLREIGTDGAPDRWSRQYRDGSRVEIEDAGRSANGRRIDYRLEGSLRRPELLDVPAMAEALESRSQGGVRPD